MKETLMGRFSEVDQDNTSSIAETVKRLETLIHELIEDKKKAFMRDKKLGCDILETLRRQQKKF